MPNMSEDSKPSKTAEPTPEQLLKLLDVQIAMSRSRRKDTRRNRTAIAVGAILLIVVGALVAFLILQQMVSEMPHSGRKPEVPVETRNSQ